MNSTSFWSWFDNEISQCLQDREISFRKIFQELDLVDGLITIVETGCARQFGNWSGDGQSTLLFDRYVSERGGHVWSIDIDSNAVAICQKQVSEHVTMVQSDSVKFLHQLSREFVESGRRIDLCYLDSFDLDWQNHLPSSLHHLKELCAIRPALNSNTLIVVDDSPAGTHMGPIICNQMVIGKGQLVAQYAEHMGIQPYFLHYQTAWKGL